MPAVVTELDDIVVVAAWLCVHDGREKRFRPLFFIHNQTTFEKPVATVLTKK